MKYWLSIRKNPWGEPMNVPFTTEDGEADPVGSVAKISKETYEYYKMKLEEAWSK